MSRRAAPEAKDAARRAMAEPKSKPLEKRTPMAKTQAIDEGVLAELRKWGGPAEMSAFEALMWLAEADPRLRSTTTSVLTLDSGKATVSGGASVSVGDARFDVVYAHQFIQTVTVSPETARLPQTVPVSANPPEEPNYINGGIYEWNMDIVGLGFSYTFDHPKKQHAAEEEDAPPPKPAEKPAPPAKVEELPADPDSTE